MLTDLEKPSLIYRQAVQLHAAGELRHAELLYRLVEHLIPGNPMLLNMFGLLALHLNQLEIARFRLERSLVMMPDYPEALNHLGLVNLKLGRLEEAKTSFLKALALAPNFINALSNLSGLYERLGERSNAIANAEKVLEIDPDHVQTLMNLGVIKLRAGELLDANTLLGHAVELDSNNPVLLSNFGCVKMRIGLYEQGCKYLMRAMEIDSNCITAHEELALHYLRHREFELGWQHYEYRNRGENFDKIKHHIPIGYKISYPSIDSVDCWSGVRVHVISEQGLGDELFFMRFYPEMVRRGAIVSYAASDRIAPLVKKWAEEESILIGSLQPNQNIDKVYFAGDIPLALGKIESPFPPSVRLYPKDSLRSTLQRKYADLARPWIGLTRKAGTSDTRSNRLYKQLPEGYLEERFNYNKGTVFDFTRVKTDGNSCQSFNGLAVVNVRHITDDLDNTLALLSLLDDYFGVSNTNIHLLAGLGKTAHIYVPYPADFRWFSSGNSEWFPGFEISREKPHEQQQYELDRVNNGNTR